MGGKSLMWPFVKKEKCIHKWKTMEKIHIEKPFNEMKDRIVGGEAKFPYWAFNEKITVIMACEKCGDLRVIKEERK